MKALILAAGYGIRLYPLTKDYPKPLLKVQDKAIIDYLIDKLDALDGLDEIIVVTNSKFIGQFRSWARKKRCLKKLTLIDDLTNSAATRRGAVGDINFVINKKHVFADLLVIGGDNLFEGDLKEFIKFTKIHPHQPVIGVYRLKRLKDACNYGVVKLDKTNRVIDFKEKPKIPTSRLVAMCLYYFPKETLPFVGEYLKCKTTKHDATGCYIDWLRKKTAVYALCFGKKWYDIGEHRFYQEAKEKF
ncbi:MAG: nucleotidyltransferase family protein [Candidatus Omnitrophica bacterium]|nr:nucleotidyltransferase family protein [Candidatus Omnitrophota bacterium]